MDTLHLRQIIFSDVGGLSLPFLDKTDTTPHILLYCSSHRPKDVDRVHYILLELLRLHVSS